ncbi:MAG: T9SS type A sorting domain-containing protein, partial [Bacteroidales bacterium]|nr:T9SS type A sorting domain-containing protein [Bacteroidales bacterium]
QTTDAGDTWQTWGPYAYLRNLKVFYNLNGFAWGDNGRLLQLANGYPVGTPTPIEAHPAGLTARAIPGTGQIEATINTTATGQATLTLTDLTGRTLGEWLVTLNEQPQTLRLPTRGLTPGMMVLSLETNGTRAACKVLVNP